jgi:hypothetical protein
VPRAVRIENTTHVSPSFGTSRPMLALNAAIAILL